MGESNWTRTDQLLPPENEVVETMDSGGNVQQLRRVKKLFWVPDMSMYVYYCPKFWKRLAVSRDTQRAAFEHIKGRL
jgi:hypothetical protein